MKPLFRTLLKQALDEANTKFLQGEGYKKTITKKQPLTPNTVEEINKVAKEIGLPLSEISISEDTKIIATVACIVKVCMPIGLSR